MRKVNTNELPEDHWTSPRGKYGSSDKEVSEALGRNPLSMDLRERHPFDVEISRIPPGKLSCPYHQHSAQWEFYNVLSGKGQVRHKDGLTDIISGDAFIFGPEEPHQLVNNGTEDLVVMIIADNPIGESCYYPDSGKWLIRSPERRIVRSNALDYYDGEE